MCRPVLFVSPKCCINLGLELIPTLLVCSLLSPQTWTPYSEVCILPVLQSGPTNYVDVRDLPSCTSKSPVSSPFLPLGLCSDSSRLPVHVDILSTSAELPAATSSPPVSLPSEFSQLPLQAWLGYLLNVPATYVCTSATDLLRQFSIGLPTLLMLAFSLNFAGSSPTDDALYSWSLRLVCRRACNLLCLFSCSLHHHFVYFRVPSIATVGLDLLRSRFKVLFFLVSFLFCFMFCVCLLYPWAQPPRFTLYHRCNDSANKIKLK